MVRRCSVSRWCEDEAHLPLREIVGYRTSEDVEIEMKRSRESYQLPCKHDKLNISSGEFCLRQDMILPSTMSSQIRSKDCYYDRVLGLDTEYSSDPTPDAIMNDHMHHKNPPHPSNSSANFTAAFK